MKRPDNNHFFVCKFTLQIRDDLTGKLIQESHGENFVGNQPIRHAKWLLRNQYKTGLTSINATDTDYAVSSDSNVLVLTDSTLAEDPASEWLMPGGLVGWADKASYAGGNIHRGNPNPSQLDANPAFTKWVWDWPTHAAVGTINSVGFIQSSDYGIWDQESISYLTQKATIEQTYSGVADNMEYLARANQNLAFGCSGTTVIYVLNGTYNVTTTYNVRGQFTAVRGIAWDSDNNFLWVIGDNSANRRIAAYNSAGILQTGPFTTTTRSYSYLAYDGAKLWTIVPIPGDQYTAWSINTSNGADISFFTFTTTRWGSSFYGGPYTNLDVRGLCWEPTYQRLWVRTRNPNGSFNQYLDLASSLSAYDRNGNKQAVDIGLASVWDSASGTNTSLTRRTWPMGDIDVIDATQFVVPLDLNTSTSGVHRVRGTGLTTRSLLSSPVVKTNTQTLKVIYTINYI